MTFYQAHALVDIGYKTGEDERIHVTNQLVFVRTLSNDEPDYVAEKIRKAVMARLTHQLNNYGVEGIKRWDPIVLSARLEPQRQKEEDTCDATGKS